MSLNLRIEEKNRVFVYEFDKLCVEQVEVAKEIALFRQIQQNNAEARSIETVIENRGIHWISIMMSYLLLEEKNDTLQNYDRNKIKGIEEYVRNLPSSHLAVLKEIVSDFFTNTSLGSADSLISQNVRKQNAALNLLAQAMRTNTPKLNENT